jgi:uncharacterized protein YndB with AHSA1/START domain
MRSIIIIAAALAALAVTPARAEVASSSAGAFLIEEETQVAATPAETWRALGQLPRWWNPEHTYSGDARRLSLDLRAGGCWCERWGNGQSVEHGRVVLVMEHEGVRTLRVVGGLGPLQELGATGVLTFTVAPDPGGAKITMLYRVSGDPGLELAALAPLVDAVLMEQFGRLARFSASGSPD